MGSAYARAAAGVPGVGNHRVTTADWARVQVELHTMYVSRATGTTPPTTTQGERRDDRQQVLGG